MRGISLVLILLSANSLSRAYEQETVYKGDYKYTFYIDGSDNVEYNEAERRCAFLGEDHLVYIKTATINQAVKEVSDSRGGHESWIGASDYYSEGHWYWLDGTKLADGFQNWAHGEPNDKLQEDCGTYKYPDNNWNDEDCPQKRGFICQKNIFSYSARDSTEIIYVKPNSLQTFAAKQTCLSLGYDIVDEKQYEHVPVTLPENLERLRANFQRECVVLGQNGFERQICNEELRSVCKAVHSYNIQLSTEQEDYMESDQIVIECTASGIPLPNVTWYQDRSLVHSYPEREVFQTSVKGKSTLTIKNAQLQDTARYRCIAMNEVGDTAKKVKTYLDIRVHPKVLPVSGKNARSTDLEPESNIRDDVDIDEASHCQGDNKNSWMLPTILSFNILILLLLFVVMCRSNTPAPTKANSHGYEFTNPAATVSKNQLPKATWSA